MLMGILMKVKDLLEVLGDLDPNLDVFMIVGNRMAVVDECRIADENDTMLPQLSGIYNYAHADSGLKYNLQVHGVIIHSSDL